jgi:tetratricopeptide (TPR) repeat protein
VAATALCGLVAAPWNVAAQASADANANAKAQREHAACRSAHQQHDIAELRRCSRALEELQAGALAGEALLWRGEALLRGGAARATVVELDEAAMVAKRAAGHLPDDERPWALACRAALEHNDLASARRYWQRQHAVAPHSATTAWLESIIALAEGDAERADEALERASKRGLESSRYVPTRASIDARLPRVAQRLRTLALLFWIAAGAWLGAQLRRRQSARASRPSNKEY